MELNHDCIFPATPHSRGKRAGSYFLRGPAGPMGAPGSGFNIQNMYNVKLTLLWVKKYT